MGELIPEYKLLKDYGDFYEGDVVTQDELDEDASVLLEEGVIELVLEDVKPLVDENTGAPSADTGSAPEPTPEPVHVPKEGKAMYKVIGPIDIFDGSGQKQGQYRTDQVVEFDIEAGDQYVKQGLAEIVE